ncbi:MAG: gliding motility-associated C-terminal domain-containing protein [Elusimicrobia bacterium]|nr:gliding motility-associated C-terminal domain-containing protein [Candidatus Liberimonas magnetica]
MGSVKVSGFPYNIESSATQGLSSIKGPSSITQERQPVISGKITSTGGNITGIWGRYSSVNKSTWTLATPVDGAFDSTSEDFTYQVSSPLADGEHIIEIKALNENGEQDAVYYTYHFWVGNAPPAVNSTAQNNLNNVIIYPNPYKPGSGTNHDRTGGVVFANLTNNAKISIFNISGELVYEANEVNGSGTLEWDGKNKSGNKVSSGVYVYLITNSGGEKKTGKISILK